MIIREFLAAASSKLHSAGIDNPEREARIILAHVLGCDRASLIISEQNNLGGAEQECANQLIMRRAAREPWGRILGCREFYGLDFHLNPHTLEPRPDSETLVTAVIDWLRKGGYHDVRAGQPLRILDLGTGTGCLLLALLHEIPHATGVGIDIAGAAVQQAQQNAARLQLDARAKFIVGDWIHSTEKGTQACAKNDAKLDTKLDTRWDAKLVAQSLFTVVISNPPYIPDDCVQDLMPEVRDYDPALALAGGSDGLSAYRAIIPQLSNLLAKDGLAAFEVGKGQGDQVAAMLANAHFSNIKLHDDLSGVARVVTATMAQSVVAKL